MNLKTNRFPTGLLMAMLLAWPAVVQAQLECFSCPWTQVTNNGEIHITGHCGEPTELTIPGTINGYPVTGLEAEAFKNCASLTSVTIGYLHL